jgi:hypothetical protein
MITGVPWVRIWIGGSLGNVRIWMVLVKPKETLTSSNYTFKYYINDQCKIQ